MRSREKCAELAGVALRTAYNTTLVAEAHRAAGRLRHAVMALGLASTQLGRADSLVEFCDLDPTLGVTQLFARLAVLRGQLADDCEQGWSAGLSGLRRSRKGR